MRVAVVGGGPGGLYLSALLKQSDPAHEVTVFERNRADDTFGFGVVFSDTTMAFISDKDQRIYPGLVRRGVRWEPIVVRHQGRTVSCGGIGFNAIERKLLLQLLQSEASGRGVELRFEAAVAGVGELASEYDLVVAADGVNSTLRTELAAQFRPRIVEGGTRFTWLGVTLRYPSFTFLYEADEHGVWGAHIYPYREDRSTFIVETDEGTWQRAGADRWSEADTIAHSEHLFARHLEGRRLLSNRSLWARFRTVRNAVWHVGNVVLLGDAAHTAHFSVGSGTKMAMEDALALTDALERNSALPAALEAYEAERRPRVEHIQRAAAASFDWWEGFRHVYAFPAPRFTFHLLTRAQFRYDTLKDRDPAFLAAVEAEAGLGDLRARMAGTAQPGPPADRRSRLEAAAGGGVAWAFSEPIAADSGLDPSWREAIAGLQVVARLVGGDRESLVAAARAAEAAGFHGLELFFAHATAMARLISPLTNPVPLEQRLQVPLEALAAVRAAWPADRPLLVAFAADDFAPGGISPADALETARRFHAAGATMIDVLGGHVTPRSRPPYGRAFRMLIAGRVRNEAHVPVITAGGITDLDDVRTVLLSGRADMVALDAVRLCE